MVEKLTELMKIQAGKRKLVGFIVAVVVGASVQLITNEINQWIYICVLYGLLCGFNIYSKWINFKKNGNGAKSVT